MGDMKLYKADLLAQFLIDKLALTPVRFALLGLAVNVGASLIRAYFLNTLVTQSGAPGLLQDWNALIKRIVIYPTFLGFYLWASGAPTRLIRGLQQSNAVTIARRDIAVIENAHHGLWRTFVPLGIAAVFGTLSFVIRRDIASWVGTSIWSRATVSVEIMLGIYALSATVIVFITIVWALRVLLGRKQIRVDPLHPDGCGGLSALGSYSLKTAYLAAVVGLDISLTEYDFIVHGIARQHWVLHLTVPLYITLAFVLFLAPLISAHRGMRESKERLLGEIAREYWHDYQDVVENLDKEKALKDRVQRLQHLKRLYELTEDLPVWPLNTSIVRRFLGGISAPLIPILIGLISEFLTKYLGP